MLQISYGLRILCVASIGLGIVHLSFDLILRASLPSLASLLANRTARFRERFLFTMALLPPMIALVATSLLIVPAFISQETNHQAEGTGIVCTLLSVAAWLWYIAACSRSVLLLARTIRFEHALRRNALRIDRPRTLWLIPSKAPLLALVGLIHPRVLLSREILQSDVLPSEALDVALDHEYAHARQLDNWKLLTLSLIPSFPFTFAYLPSFQKMWKRYAEWAADDEAVAGNPQRALLLADSLMVFARSASHAFQNMLATSLASHDREISERVHRLLAEVQPAQYDVPNTAFSVRTVILLSLSFAACAAAAFALPFLHEAAEYMLHLG